MPDVTADVARHIMSSTVLEGKNPSKSRMASEPLLNCPARIALNAFSGEKGMLMETSVHISILVGDHEVQIRTNPGFQI